MKTSTKVILKFQIFTSLIVLLILFVVNIIFFKFWVDLYNDKARKVSQNAIYRVDNVNVKWWKYRNWQILNWNCFVMYEEKYCLTEADIVFYKFYVFKDKSFFIEQNIVIDTTEFWILLNRLWKFSVLLFLLYVFISYFLGYIFLQTIYKKLFIGIRQLQSKWYIDLQVLNLDNQDELYILFDKINKYVEAISSFNKYLSHEIKTPLMRISSSIDLLKLKNCVDKDLLNQIVDQVKYIWEIIDSLNKFVFIETKNISVEREKINVCALLKEVIEQLGIDYKKIKCNNDLIWTTNKTLLKMVFVNLLKNAVQHGVWEFKIEINKNFITICNKIEKEEIDLSRITDKFYKWDWSSGLWIGLYLVDKVAKILWLDLKIYIENKFFCVKIINR